jgi:proteasome beta subunit
VTERALPPLILDAPSPGSSFLDLISSLGHVTRLPSSEEGTRHQVPEGTTVLALSCHGGVVMAGDRRATEGNLVAHNSIQKVFRADEFSAVAIAGAAGLALEMVRLFQVELEHYEKIEGVRLSLDGKANFLARLVRSQLPMAFQGLVVVPLFAGFDDIQQRGRLFSFDIIGGRYEEQEFASTGSGSRLARSYLRTAYQPDLPPEEGVALAVQALVSASVEDTATGGPDLRRGILPNVVVVDAHGVEELADEAIRPAAEAAIEAIK